MQDAEKKRDEVMPADVARSWRFDDEVTDVFEDMLERSVPQYEMMRTLTFRLGAKFVHLGTDIVDLGCSRGEAMAPLIEQFGAMNRFVGVEVSEPMLEACKKRFEGYINCGVVDIKNIDLREDFPHVKASLILSVLTIQFTPIEYRQHIMKKIYESLLPGGAFLMVEKVLGDTAYIDHVMVEEYYDIKRAKGYSDDQIERKKLALEGVLVPITDEFNRHLLAKAGFTAIDCYWRFLNFAGYIALK